MFRSLLQPSTTLVGRWVNTINRTSILASISPSVSSSPLLQNDSIRSVVMDRATRVVSLKRRARRELLRRIARRESGGINFAKRKGTVEPPLSSYETSAANSNQFLAFLARQTNEREKKEATKVPESAQIIRDVSQPAWQIDFQTIKTLWEFEENQSFRACEEFLCALSDPTTELGQSGLSREDFNWVLNKVETVMNGTLAKLQPAFLDANGEFGAMDAEDQYLYAGCYSMLYLIGKLSKNEAACEKVLLHARSQNVLPPSRTLMAQAMKFDVYPEHSPEALKASVQPKTINTTAQ